MTGAPVRMLARCTAAALAALVLASACARRQPAPDAYRGPDPSFLSAPALAQPPADPTIATIAGEGVEAAYLDQIDLGVDAAAKTGLGMLRDRRTLLVTNSLAAAESGAPAVDRLLRIRDPRWVRVALLQPPFGRPLRTPALDAALAAHTGLDVAEVPPNAVRPPEAILEGIDAIAIDYPLTGLRWAQEEAFLGGVLEEAARRRLRVVVLDRPPMSGLVICDGPVSDRALMGTITGFLPVPALHGCTTGELARLYNGHFGIQADLHVVAIAGPFRRWERNRWLTHHEPRGEWPLEWQENRRRLREDPLFQYGFIEMNATLELARFLTDGMEVPAVFPENGNMVLRLRPTRRTPDEVTAILASADLGGPVAETAEVEGTPGLRIIVPAESPFPAATLGWRLARALDREAGKGTSGLYGADILRSDREDRRTTQDAIDQWQSAPDFSRFLRARTQVLLYPP